MVEVSPIIELAWSGPTSAESIFCSLQKPVRADTITQPTLSGDRSIFFGKLDTERKLQRIKDRVMTKSLPVSEDSIDETQKLIHVDLLSSYDVLFVHYCILTELTNAGQNAARFTHRGYVVVVEFL